MASKVVVIVWLVLFMAFYWKQQVLAADNGQYSQVDPSIRKWIEGLKNKNGSGCCDTADGYDAQYDTLNGKYRVFIKDKWYVVPDYALLDVPNKLGVAKVWYIHMNDVPVIRCFIPGAGG